MDSVMVSHTLPNALKLDLAPVAVTVTHKLALPTFYISRSHEALERNVRTICLTVCFSVAVITLSRNVLFPLVTGSGERGGERERRERRERRDERRRVKVEARAAGRRRGGDGGVVRDGRADAPVLMGQRSGDRRGQEWHDNGETVGDGSVRNDVDDDDDKIRFIQEDDEGVRSLRSSDASSSSGESTSEEDGADREDDGEAEEHDIGPRSGEGGARHQRGIGPSDHERRISVE